MKRYLALLLFVVALVPAYAGYKALDWLPNGSMNLRYLPKTEEVLVTVAASTAKYSPGPCLLRLDGVAIARVEGAPYYFSFGVRMGDVITPLHEGNMGQKNARAIVVDEEFFLREHNLEAFFYSTDDKGRSKIERADAPTQRFMLKPLEPTDKVDVTQTQLDEAVRKGYEQGRDEATKSLETQNKELLARLNELSEENTNLKSRLIVQQPSTREDYASKDVSPDMVKDWTVSVGMSGSATSHKFLWNSYGLEETRLFKGAQKYPFKGTSIALLNKAETVIVLTSDMPFTAVLKTTKRTVEVVVRRQGNQFVAVVWGPTSSFESARLVVTEGGDSRTIEFTREVEDEDSY